MEYLYCYVKIEIYTAVQFNIICCRYLLRSLFTRDQFGSYAMELIYSVNLICMITLNVLFFFSAICLNSLVIVSFWRSVQLRKKLLFLNNGPVLLRFACGFNCYSIHGSCHDVMVDWKDQCISWGVATYLYEQALWLAITNNKRQ